MRPVEEVQLDDKEDFVILELDKSKKFPTRSLYHFRTFPGVIDGKLSFLWNIKASLKVGIFLWQMKFEILSVGTCIKRRGWKWSQNCVLCETVTIFTCSLAVFTWCVIRDCFGCDRIPHSLEDFWENFAILHGRYPTPTDDIQNRSDLCSLQALLGQVSISELRILSWIFRSWSSRASSVR